MNDLFVALDQGSRMRLSVMGEGEPTILLDAGWGHWSVVWAGVQPLIAERTRVVAFDRLGLGKSDPGPWPRSSFQIVDELQEALAAAGIGGPYVYVGHSFGAVHARTLAHRSPEVTGLVLVDPVVEALGVSRPFRRMRDEMDRRFARLMIPSRLGLLTPASYLFGVPPFAKKLPKAAARELRSGYKPDVIRTIRGELIALDESMDQLARLGAPSVPFEVLSAEEDWLPGESEGPETRAQAIHRKLAASVRGGAHRVVPGSGHDIHLDAPAEVTRAVEDLLARIT